MGFVLADTVNHPSCIPTSSLISPPPPHIPTSLISPPPFHHLPYITIFTNTSLPPSYFHLLPNIPTSFPIFPPPFHHLLLHIPTSSVTSPPSPSHFHLLFTSPLLPSHLHLLIHNCPTSANENSLLQLQFIHISSVQEPTYTQSRCITLLTKFNVVDNSKQGQKTKRYKKAYAIGFFKNNKRQTADVGDVIKVAVRGETCRALIVGTRKPKGDNMVPRYDNNNIVLVDENLAPLGTRIRGPIPNILRKQRDKYSKVLAIASKFV